MSRQFTAACETLTAVYGKFTAACMLTIHFTQVLLHPTSMHPSCTLILHRSLYTDQTLLSPPQLHREGDFYWEMV